VNKYLNDGWQLHGAPYSNASNVHFQAMTKGLGELQALPVATLEQATPPAVNIYLPVDFNFQKAMKEPDQKAATSDKKEEKKK